VEWLGEVPGHWAVVPLKYVVEMRSGGTPSKERVDYWNGTVSWASSKDLKVDELYDTVDHVTELAVLDGAAAVVAAGASLVVVRGMILAHSFPVVRAMRPMAINQDLKAVLPRESLDGRFLPWLLRGSARESLSRLDEAAHGTKALRMEAWTSMELPIPPVHEQVSISEFLDRETAKIDALVAEQERLITLLKEKRQAVISHTVTKGLNPEAPMKDSGVDWVGPIPAHWTVTPLKGLTEQGRPIMYGIVLPGPDVGVGIPILKGGNVKAHRMNLDALARTTEEIEAPYARARLRTGDLVYSIRGTIGDCEEVPPALENCNITQDVARIAPRGDVSVSWLRFALLSHPLQEHLACGSLGAAVRGINIFDLKRVPVPTPPSEEQVAIAGYLANACAMIDTLITEAEKSESVLIERRSALITAAVTGQIDVRGLAPAEAA
jgi:type I restriction enzyme S subunit